MKPISVLSMLGGIALCLLLNACSKSRAATTPAEIEHGRYLVERVGMCVDCHSPRGPDGQWIQDKWLQGAEMPFAATVPMPAWASLAPSLVGLPHYTDDQLMELLTEAQFADGRKLRPPMPEFRLNEPDARAVIAYLRSLQPEE